LDVLISSDLKYSRICKHNNDYKLVQVDFGHNYFEDYPFLPIKLKEIMNVMKAIKLPNEILVGEYIPIYFF